MMSRRLVLLTICLAVFSPRVSNATEYPNLLWLSQDIEMDTPLEAPTFDDVISDYGFDEDDLDAITDFLENALPPAWADEGIEATDASREGDVIEVTADVGVDEVTISMSTTDAIFTLDVTPPLYPVFAYELTMEFEIPTTTGLAPNRLFLYSATTTTCKCDDTSGGACTITMCDNIETCTGGPNGSSCAHTAYVLQ